MYGNPVLRKSVKQGSVTRATTQAKFYAMADATQEVVWFKNLLSELNEMSTNPIVLYEDNSAAKILVG